MAYTMTTPQWEVWSESVPGGQYGQGSGTRLLCQGLFSTPVAAESHAEHLRRRAALPDTGEHYWCARVWVRQS